MQASTNTYDSVDRRCQDPQACQSAAAAVLNEECFCINLDHQALQVALESTLGEPGLAALIKERCPHVFAANPVFVSERHVRQMKGVIGAIESIVAMPAYRQKVLADAPAIASHQPDGAKGVFYGYDFHVNADKVALIEINTNAGGAMLNAAMAKAQRACCTAVENLFSGPQTKDLEASIMDMFHREWELAGKGTPLRTIAIVDENPQEQYLYPEFLLFQRLFERHGISAIITSPSELSYLNGTLRHKQTQIDLVYNRLTDFMLEAPANTALRMAYLENSVVLTPHPQAHALYANKRNLALFSDRKCLSELGVSGELQNLLVNGIPRTEIVKPADAMRLWSDRRKLFFKPASGYGSRATYRGDKLTRRVWEEILVNNYIAQEFAAPSERATGTSVESQRLKFDVRAYVYDGEIQWLAARLYQGQTTNFRTPGGGFAPVYCL